MLCTKSDFNPPMWVNICRTWGRPQSRTGSEAQRSDRVRIERHKPAEATYAAIECYSTWTQSFRCASLPVLLSLTHIGAYKQFCAKPWFHPSQRYKTPRRSWPSESCVVTAPR